jgi:alkaline phosphatase
MFKALLIACLVCGVSAAAQPLVYSTANAHSHNDYEKQVPFREAYRHQFGSIEADIFLLNGSEELYVAHHLSDLNKQRRTLDSLYLLPLVNCIKQNNGFVYADTALKLQLLIDIKTEAVATLQRLIAVLQKYPELTRASSLQVVISGNRPSPDSFHTYPSFIHFDGVLGRTYSETALSRISLLSVSFQQFSKWKGIGVIPESERLELARAVSEAHRVAKPVRFWAAPDTNNAWNELKKLQVDYINTDRIAELSSYLKKSH